MGLAHETQAQAGEIHTSRAGDAGTRRRRGHPQEQREVHVCARRGPGAREESLEEQPTTAACTGRAHVDGPRSRAAPPSPREATGVQRGVAGCA